MSESKICDCGYELTKERDRFRAALEKIIPWGEQADGWSVDAGNARECARIARVALGAQYDPKTGEWNWPEKKESPHA